FVVGRTVGLPLGPFALSLHDALPIWGRTDLELAPQGGRGRLRLRRLHQAEDTVRRIAGLNDGDLLAQQRAGDPAHHRREVPHVRGEDRDNGNGGDSAHREALGLQGGNRAPGGGFFDREGERGRVQLDQVDTDLPI